MATSPDLRKTFENIYVIITFLSMDEAHSRSLICTDNYFSNWFGDRRHHLYNRPSTLKYIDTTYYYKLPYPLSVMSIGHECYYNILTSRIPRGTVNGTKQKKLIHALAILGLLIEAVKYFDGSPTPEHMELSINTFIATLFGAGTLVAAV
ncbi:hypothetical protein BDC45DRAFT_533919 [Circinella umbellata]|nr:hypothetical protein BDC45DRAFT_533919 [Circinella umbellata]